MWRITCDPAEDEEDGQKSDREDHPGDHQEDDLERAQEACLSVS